MARVLVCESSTELTELLGHVVARLGHEPVAFAALGRHSPPELVIVEPADREELASALAVRATWPDVPLVCVTRLDSLPRIHPLDDAIGIQKPFALEDVAEAVTRALGSTEPPGDGGEGRGSWRPPRRMAASAAASSST